MDKEKNFTSFLVIEKNRFEIFLFDEKNLKNLYKNEIKFQNEFNKIDFIILSNFLDDNIYKIEKLTGKFIENIYVIIKLNINLNTNICIKKDIYDKLINQKKLENTLNDARDLFKENYPNQNIIHMVIDNYLINEKRYSSITTELESDHLSLEIKFISLHNDYFSKFIKVLENYQIKLARVLCGYYINDFLHENDSEFLEMAHKLVNGHNKNEVLLVPKNEENHGIFEKFFHIFN